eukprot:jgi/Chlat1/8794/Chrsp90S08138
MTPRAKTPSSISLSHSTNGVSTRSLSTNHQASESAARVPTRADVKGCKTKKELEKLCHDYLLPRSGTKLQLKRRLLGNAASSIRVPNKNRIVTNDEDEDEEEPSPPPADSKPSDRLICNAHDCTCQLISSDVKKRRKTFYKHNDLGVKKRCIARLNPL